MMANNVRETYGSSRFPNMDICAKSGTAEVGGGKKPNAWFAGFLRNSDAPYAFVVVLEEGGSGAMQQAMWPLRFWTLWSTATDTCSSKCPPKDVFLRGIFLFYLKISCNFISDPMLCGYGYSKNHTPAVLSPGRENPFTCLLQSGLSDGTSRKGVCPMSTRTDAQQIIQSALAACLPDAAAAP